MPTDMNLEQSEEESVPTSDATEPTTNEDEDELEESEDLEC
jgi:hypothetical protein